jgi:peptidylprolyl isomerase
MLKKIHLVTLSSLGLLMGYHTLEAQNPNYTENISGSKPPVAAPEHTGETEHIDMKKLSEAFGHFIGRNLKTPGLSFDLESIIQGIRGGAAGQPSPLTEKEYEEMMAAVQERAFKEMSQANLKSADEFMAKNQRANGVIELIPGKLQYMILREGQGSAVEAHSSPKIHYTGKYQDGTVFGTSEEMGGPITIPLDQTIPGFSKGIVGMKEGEKRRLFVHPDLGYGTTGQLPPNELLIFDIELVKAHSDEDHHKETQAENENEQDEEEASHHDDEDFFEENSVNLDHQGYYQGYQGSGNPSSKASPAKR